MHKKNLGIMFVIIGVLILTGVGCSNTSVIPFTGNEPITAKKTVTIEECAELFAMVPKIDLRYNSLPASYPWTLKYYDRMAALEKKYNITQDELSKICKAKSIEPGFNEEVKKQEKNLGFKNE